MCLPLRTLMHIDPLTLLSLVWVAVVLFYAGRLPIGQTADTYPEDGRYINGLFQSSVGSRSPFHPGVNYPSPYTLVRWPNSQAVHNSLLNHT